MSKKIAEVPCWERRWVDEEEAIGRLNITRPEWDRFFKDHASQYIGGNYDMEQLNRIMVKAVQVRRQ